MNGELLVTIEAQQDTRADLDFWAETYPVTDHEMRENNTTESTSRDVNATL